MNINIKNINNINNKDFSHARHFAIKGMNLHWYTTGKLQLYLYSHYFWKLELLKATRAIGAYNGDTLMGVLLISMTGQPRIYNSLPSRIYVAVFEWIMNNFFGETTGVYDRVNEVMLRKMKENFEPDGELNFFAVAPEAKGQGIGTMLLTKLKELEKGRLIYLFTDSGSSYRFYQKKGFMEAGRQKITMKIGQKDIDLECFLFYLSL